jgi:hypothetical protein
MIQISRALTRICWLIGSTIAWSVVYYLIVVRDVGTLASFWAPWRLLAYVAFILAPAITFMPIAHRLRLPLYDLEAIVGWSTLAFVLTFVDPQAQPTLPMLLALLVSMVIALATVLSLISYATGLRLFARRSQRYDFVRARREGYLGAIFVAGLLLLSFLKVLALTNAALLGLLVLLLEIFLLSRGGQTRTSVRVRDEPFELPEL